MKRASLAVLALSAGPLLVGLPHAQAASPDVVLAEVYGGGGNTGAPYTHDFVELFNRSGSAVSLAGWSVQYAAASGSTWSVTALSGSIPAGRRYLVRLAAGAGAGVALPTPDATGTTSLSATAGKVALVTSTTALSCGADCDQASGVRDFVGYGSANDYETAAAPGTSNTTAARRTDPTTDGDNNSADFATLAPTPENRFAAPDVLVAEVYGGGGNTGAPYRNDFVEMFNHGPVAVSLSGWSVQYAAAAGTSWTATALSGTVQPGARYLVKLGSGGSAGALLLPADATGSTNLSATSGKVALVAASGALTCGSDCDHATNVRDFVGYGTANDYETAAAPTGSNTTSLNRGNLSVDSDSNTADFATGAPSPSGSGGSGPGPCPTGTLIRTIQGTAHVSSLNGQAVSGVKGIVTGKKSNGFYLQDPCPDASDATSEGILVYTSSAPTVLVGDEVSVNATVSEYRSGGASSANLTITELVSPTVTVTATGRPVPTAVIVGSGGRVPPSAVVNDDGSGDVETSGTFDVATDGIDFWESLEFMRVSLSNPVAVGPRNSYGEIPVVNDDGTAGVRTPRGGIVLRQGDVNPEIVTLDDAASSGSTPSGTNVGDHFSAAAVGVIDYLAGGFRLELLSTLSRVDGGLAAESTAFTPVGQLSVATFNVENLDALDPQSKFDGLGAAVVTNLKSPGILVIEEIQDNDGPANSGVVSADQTWGRLISAISAAGGPSYSFKQIDPVDDADGGEPGGNIRVGFLYRTDSGLTWAGGTPGTATQAVVASSSGNGADPVSLNVNPGRIDPTNSAFDASRKPLVGKFYFEGSPLFVIGNHWNSKGGDDPDFGRFQPPNHPSETKRGQQAQLVAAFYDSIKAIDPNARVVVAGDLNDFQFSAAVSTLKNTGLTALADTLPESERYSYVYSGNSQFLDHILLSPALVSAGYDYDVVHLNSEFAVQLSDHDPQLVRLQL